MQCRLVLDLDEKRVRAVRMGVTDPRMILSIEDMVNGDCLFATTGVTTRALWGRASNCAGISSRLKPS
jgi:fructose-1,6-bisphosphatase II / sedoheptulose-1,7-bisphosphatase